MSTPVNTATSFCLYDYVGLSSCDATPPLSGVYIQTLPGMDFAKFELVADADQVSYTGVWDDVRSRASRRFRMDFIGAINDRRKNAFAIKQLAQTVNIGRTLGSNQGASTPVLTPNTQAWYGHTIELNNPGDVCVCSNLQAIFIQSVDFYVHDNTGSSPSASDVVLQIVDADMGTVLYTTTNYGITGGTWTSFWVNQLFSGVRRILVLVNGSMADFSQIDLSNFALQGFADDISCSCDANTYGAWFGWDTCGCVAQVRGVTTDVNYVQTFGLNTFGVSTKFSVQCTYDNLICNNKDFFLNAWMYCLALEMCDEIIFSSRLNRWTTIDKKMAQDMKKLYMLQYRGGFDGPKDLGGMFYEGALHKAVENIPLNGSDCCTESDSIVVFREAKL